MRIASCVTRDPLFAICRFADLLTFARSISHRAAAILRPGVTGRVLASFERVCDLVTDAGEVAALVWGGIGNGPLNVVLDGRPGAALPAGSRFAVRECFLTVSDVTVDLARAVLWDARPDWDVLRARRARVVAAAHAARSLSSGRQSGSLLKQAGPAVETAAAAFQGAWQRGERAGLEVAVRALCGLGPGLTPAGDDWLAGWLLAQHLGVVAARVREIADLIAEAAADRTTTLSRAFLACAAAGEADEDWHDLLQALTVGAYDRIENATQRILGQGATSGAFMLAGFFIGIDVG